MSDGTDRDVMEAWNTVTPYSQIRTSFDPLPGQYDWLVVALNPGKDREKYAILAEFKILAPASAATGPGSTFKRTLYVGTNKDPLAQLPETRLQSGTLRFLKQIAAANKLSTGDQADAQLCHSLLGQAFGCRINERKYVDRTGQDRIGADFGRNVTPVNTLPAKLDIEAATLASPPVANGSGLVGTTFSTE